MSAATGLPFVPMERMSQAKAAGCSQMVRIRVNESGRTMFSIGSVYLFTRLVTSAHDAADDRVGSLVPIDRPL
jgi:hypothetical protein